MLTEVVSEDSASNEEEISIGRAKIMVEGSDISVISYSRGIKIALEVEKALSEKNISANKKNFSI